MSKIPVSHIAVAKPSTTPVPLQVDRKKFSSAIKDPPKLKTSDEPKISSMKIGKNLIKSTPREPLRPNNNNQLKRSASTSLTDVSKKQPKLAPKSAKSAIKIAPYDYKARYNDIFEKYSDLKTEHDDMKTKYEELSDRLEVDQNKIEDYETNNSLLLKELEQTKSDNDKLQMDLNGIVDKSKKEATDISSQLTDVKMKLQYKTVEYDTLKSKLDEEIEKNIKLFSEMNENLSKLSSLSCEVTFLKSKQAILEKTNCENNDFISKLKIENENLSERLKVLEKQHDSLKTDLETKTEECTKFVGLYNYETSEKSKLSSAHSDLLMSFNTMKMNKEHLEIKNEEQRLEIENLTAQNGELQKNIESMYENHKILHNTVQDLKGHIRVFCRVKPVLKEENSKAALNVDIIDSCTMEVEKTQINSTSNLTKKQNTKHTFAFDGVFPSNTSQAEIFKEVSSLIQSALDGYNVCIFAYGQTGSGKTYTMEGNSINDSFGIIPRAINMIFDNIPKLQKLGWDLKITASFLEIYNENIFDLLDPSKDQVEHSIKMVDSKGTDVYVSNLKEESVISSEHLNKLLMISQKNRQTAATLCNERSSRSHSVTKLKISASNQQRGEKYNSYLNLVDLAGSEKAKTSQRMEETKSINKSLSELSKVILALQEKQTHVPYRNSKLTHLLMPSLGGNSKTLMLVNVSQLDDCYNETVNSLRFASQVNNCRNGVSKKNISTL